MIRAATPDDLDAIMRIERRSFPTDAWSAELMAAELASPHGQYLVDVEDDATGSEGSGSADATGSGALPAAGEVVGYGGVRALRGSADSDIQTIALDAAHRGAGRGRALLRALLAEAVDRGARETFLEVRADNPAAQALYLSEGFAELGRRPGYYQPDDVAAVIMRLDLSARRIAGAGVSAADGLAGVTPAAMTGSARPDGEGTVGPTGSGRPDGEGTDV